MIIATAGHVDHGKTSLVEQLTGENTDRTEEERRRGLSINLGYAYRDVDGATRFGIIDVPGHRRFINTMIAGVSGIDLGMLVVAADDGVMPQTIEHCQVMQLLGVENYLLVVTKIDRADAEQVEAVTHDSLSLLPAGTPACAVSNTTGQGIADLVAKLEHLTVAHRQAQPAGHFRVSLDRAFNLKGAGLVCTGTVAAGEVKPGDELRLQPQNKRARVRQVYRQGSESEKASIGDRCAVNLVGEVEKKDIERGDWLTAPKAIDACTAFDARLSLLPDLDFVPRHMATVKLHIGAKRVDARLARLVQPGQARRFAPGDEAIVRLLAARPVVCCHGDRFLVQDYGESCILGGGEVLVPHASVNSRADLAWVKYLEAMRAVSPSEALESLVIGAGQTADLDAFQLAWNLTDEDLETVLTGADLQDARRVQLETQCLLVPALQWSDGLAALERALAGWLQENPAEQGMRPAGLKRALGLSVDARLVLPLVIELVKTGVFEQAGGLLRTKGWQARLDDGQVAHWQTVERALTAAGRDIPRLQPLKAETGLQQRSLEDTLYRATRDGKLVKLNPDRYALPGSVRVFADAALALAKQGAFTVIDFRDRTGSGRKLAVEMLEFFDDIGFTRRRGDERVVVDAELPARRFSI